MKPYERIKMNTISKLNQANVDLYNNHPTQHTAIVAVYGVVTVVVLHKLLRKIATSGNANRP